MILKHAQKICKLRPKPIRTCTMRIDNPVSFAKVSLTFLHGFGETSKDALNARLC